MIDATALKNDDAKEDAAIDFFSAIRFVYNKVIADLTRELEGMLN